MTKPDKEFIGAVERVQFVEKFSVRVECQACGAVRHVLAPLPKGDLPVGACRACGSMQQKITMHLAALAAIIQKVRR